MEDKVYQKIKSMDTQWDPIKSGEELDAKVAELDPDKAYVFQIDVGDAPREAVTAICKRFRENILKRKHFKNFIIIPTSNCSVVRIPKKLCKYLKYGKAM